MDDFLDIEKQESKLLASINDVKSNEKVITALKLAKQAHKGQKRDEGQDYIIHPIRIANILISELSIYNTNLIIGAILHDVIEDSKIEIKEIKKKFGTTVATLVKKLTRDKTKETKKEKFEKVIKDSKEVRLLKSVDWLDNLRSFPYRKKRDQRYFRHVKEASEMYLPLAKVTNNYIANEMKKVIKELKQ